MCYTLYAILERKEWLDQVCEKRATVQMTICIAVVLFCLTSTSGYGLEVFLGGKIGANMGWNGGEDYRNWVEHLDGENGVLMGFSGGVTSGIRFIDYFALQPEITYASLGGSLTYSSLGTEYLGRHRAHTIAAQIYVKPRLPIGQGALYALAGPDLFLVLGKIVYEEEYETDSTTTLYVEKQVPDNRFVFGLAGGIGYEHPVGPGKLSVDVCYSRTLTRMRNEYDIQFNMVTLMAGYALRL
jgi:hypothetical protein